MMGAARSASLPDVAPLNTGTARPFWRGAPMRHSTLALPGLSGRSHPALALPEKTGKNHPYATQLWHCQGILAPWLPYVLASPTSHSANCNAACANCNENPIAMPVQ